MLHTFENKFISFSVENPFYTWWKARKIFKFPKLKFIFMGSKLVTMLHPNKPFQDIAKILDVVMWDISWKDKFDEPRYESPAFLYVSFFRLFGFKVKTNIDWIDECGYKNDGDMYYWEYLLDYVYYNRKLKEVSIWKSGSKLYRKNTSADGKQFEVIVPITNFSLTKKGFKALQKELENEKQS